MKKIKHIAILASTVLASVALCSASYYISNEEKLDQVITVEHPQKDIPSKPNEAFKEGEILAFRIHYGMMDAGEIVMEVKPDLIEVAGRKVYHVVGNGYSKGTFDWFYKVRDRYETFIDKDAMLPWMFVRRCDEGGYIINQDYTFNHYTNKVDVGSGEKVDVPSGTQDMISAFYSARNLDLTNAKEGDVFTINSIVDKELWPLKIRYVGKEKITCAIGTFNCVKFRPIVQKGRIFKREDDLNVWLTDDKNHIPLRAQAKLVVGSVKLDIVSVKNLANPTSEVK
ncbi:MAG: hypothetical protein K0S53_2975 [Bacteroidetes bacterium]|jgi:hypothetical protein|nr:hypothetical protein [Bacteroidota bacterium]MDF2453410.1 hypothetical protein [Bacteroidota bacterium]